MGFSSGEGSWSAKLSPESQLLVYLKPHEATCLQGLGIRSNKNIDT